MKYVRTLGDSLKTAVAFTFFCACLFVYTHNAYADHGGCHDCGSVSNCEDGSENIDKGWSHCTYSNGSCEVGGVYGSCPGGSPS